jgi:hypothetical protein
MCCVGLCPFLHVSEHLTWVKVNKIVTLRANEGVWVSGGVNPLVLSVGTRWWSMVRITPRGKRHMRLSVSHSWSGRSVDGSPLFLNHDLSVVWSLYRLFCPGLYTWRGPCSPDLPSCRPLPCELALSACVRLQLEDLALSTKALGTVATVSVFCHNRYEQEVCFCLWNVHSWIQDKTWLKFWSRFLSSFFHGGDSCGLWRRVTW